MSFSDTPILSISSKNIKNCQEISKIMLDLGIISKITSNNSIVRSNGSIVEEKGCDIKFTSFECKNQIIQAWDELKKKYQLSCGYINIPNKFSGCIYNYFEPPVCPYLKK